MIVRLYSCNTVERFPSVNKVSKNTMFSIKPGCCLGMDDKKLASICIWSCIGHRESSFFMGKFWVKFILKFFSVNTLTTSSGSCRIASLDHKVSNNPVKDDPIIIALLCESEKVFRCSRHFISENFDGDIAMIGVENNVRVFHRGEHIEVFFSFYF